MYVRAVGNVRSFQDVIHIQAHDIRPLEDHNEMTHHLLETIYLHCVNTKGPLQVLAAPSLLPSPRGKNALFLRVGHHRKHDKFNLGKDPITGISEKLFSFLSG